MTRPQPAGPMPWFGVDEHGRTIARERVCECGRSFTQFQLSERFMLAAERRSPRVADLVQTQCPGLFVPVHCPRCERVDLRRRAQLDEAQDMNRLPFGERPDAA